MKTDETTATAVALADDEFDMPATDDGQTRWLPQPQQQQQRGLAALGVNEASALVRQVMESLPRRNDRSSHESAVHQASVIEMLEGMAPSDSHEAALCGAFVAIYTHTMDAARRAAFGASPEAMNQMHKAARTLATMSEAIGRYRNKGAQSMRIEHVHVHEGGQAIVGQVGGAPSKPGGGTKKGQ